MIFKIEIRQSETGEGKHFDDKQQIADFLAGRDDADKWEGHQCLGSLPAPTGAKPTLTEEVVRAAARAARAASPDVFPVEPSVPAELKAAAPAPRKSVAIKAKEAVKAAVKKITPAKKAKRR